MNNAARPWIGLVFKCLAVLALIFAGIFFMRMQEEQSGIGRYRAEGSVSRAIVTGKKLDKQVYEGRAGRSRSKDVQVISVRFLPKSGVRYADYPAKVPESALPGPPRVTGDPMKDSTFSEVLWVPRDVYDRTSVGDVLTVVDTPYSGDGPELVSDIQAFDPAVFHPRIAIALALTLLFGLAGWWIGRKRGGATAAGGSGNA
ncbi:hypothetical protein ACFQ1E_03485 [Sphingomonas canadensis]|uniref:DUF3592 domain-containing protein n=1 Tax=Sphingomonas canadensis TaxID=1219257 RepID=A0ABW3H1Z7_9SPHN|nr:hypothetical protein [Sphingomonas canadensis]MCW3834696.1 hypothetical protein [Sphingomonas canadensis]